MTEWISVKDRLPEPHHRILMWGPDGSVCTGWRDTINGGYWPADEGGWYEGDEVTHWAEVPLSPKAAAALSAPPNPPSKEMT